MGFKNDAIALDLLNPKFRFIPLNNQKRPLFAWKEDHPNGFTIRQCLEHENCQAIGVILGLNLVCVDYDGESAIDFAGDNNIDFTHKTWHIKRDSYKGFFRFKALYSPTVSQIEQLPYGEFQAKHLTRSATDDSKGEALEIFANFPRYAVILGKHPSGDNYYSPSGYGYKDLTAPPKATWDFIVDLAYRHKEPARSKKSLTKGQWERILDKCPICSRDRQHICSISKDREAIRCYQGVHYYPPTLKKGELTADGVWAFASESDIPETGRFSNFVRHKPRPIITKKSIRLMQKEKHYG